ncbi:MAG: TIGR03617 family F420-dependent LLM class oxidoreductase [Candidatus Binatia bacterium]|nr:TIGR03617 family F420-dependent LLM class oxidoreductase [Candidatus Binatia bacterium]
MRVETGLPITDWRKVGPAAAAAEAAGFDGLLSFEIANDPFAPLAFAALATERVRLGTAIAVCFPRSPMVTANTAWDLHVHSKGRFTLGLGTQVKGHNERRFSVPWTPPLPRLREYVESLRAIWRCWEKGEKLDYQGEHYRFTLMTPEFVPPPSGLSPIPISIAAVRPAMLKLAGRTCDGVRLHGFATKKYVDEVAMPQIREGLAKAGRDRSSFEVWGGGFVVTGTDEAALAKGREQIRYRIAFYGSTRSYHPVLAVHGWEDLGMKLHAMSKNGQWKEMAAEVPDEVLDTFAVIAPYDDLVGKLRDRFGGITDSITLGTPTDIPEGPARELLQDVQRIESPFRGFPTEW